MREVYDEINSAMVAMTNAVVRYEKQLILGGEFEDITCNDVHIIEAVGIEDAKNMSTIARLLSVTVGSLTTAMNALVRKGYVERERSKEDRRVVYICLSEKGRRVYQMSKVFHERILDQICWDCSAEEKQLIIKLIEKSHDRLLNLDPEKLLEE